MQEPWHVVAFTVQTPVSLTGKRFTRSSLSRQKRHRIVTRSCAEPPPASLPHLLHTQQQQEHFLRNVWGRQPLLIRNFLPQCAHLLSPDDLHALSTDPSTPSRLIRTHRTQRDGDDAHPERGKSGEYTDIEKEPGNLASPPYSLHLGPFDTGELAALPQCDWTVLLQGVDRRSPAVADVLEAVSFLPSWRLDDVQVSYATRGGGVGPHVDNYDVFLVQGFGMRRWRVGNTAVTPANEQLAPDCDVRVLANGFCADADYILHPGDALYVPPRHPHHGICASDHCATYSIGFRAPSVASLLAAWVDEVSSARNLHEVFLQDDPEDLVRQSQNRGEVSPVAAGRAYEELMRAAGSTPAVDEGGNEFQEQFVNWFASEVGRQKTSVGEADFEPMPDDDIERAMSVVLNACDDEGYTALEPDGGHVTIRQREGAVFTYTESSLGETTLYVDGERWGASDTAFVRTICNCREIAASELGRRLRGRAGCARVLRDLMGNGHLYVVEFEEEEESGSIEERIPEEGLDRDGAS